MLIKPLHIAFEFNDALQVHELFLIELAEIITTIRTAGGDIHMITRSRELQEQLSQKFNGIPIKDE